MKKIFTAILAATFCTALFAQTEVTDYRPGVTAEGITYFLPKTAFHVTVTAQRVVHHPGEYCQYAERYLRLRDVPQQQYEEWAISKVEVASYGVADKTQAYTIKLKSKTSAPLVRLSAAFWPSTPTARLPNRSCPLLMCSSTPRAIKIQPTSKRRKSWQQEVFRKWPNSQPTRSMTSAKTVRSSPKDRPISCQRTASSYA